METEAEAAKRPLVVDHEHRHRHVMKKVYARVEEVLECSHCSHFFRGFNWYRCKSMGCKYILHPTCAESPAIISSFMHPWVNHDLEEVIAGCPTKCQVCNVESQDKMYRCKVCTVFCVHPTCTLWPKHLSFHELHSNSHPLQLQVFFPASNPDSSLPPSPPPPQKPPIEPYPPPPPPPLPPRPQFNLLRFKPIPEPEPLPLSPPRLVPLPFKVSLPPPPPLPPPLKSHPIQIKYLYPFPPPPPPPSTTIPKPPPPEEEALAFTPPSLPFTCHACKETSYDWIFYHCGRCNESYHPMCLLRFSLTYKNSHGDLSK